MINPKKIRQGILLTVGLVALVKKTVDKELNKVYKKGHITKGKQIQITKKIVTRATKEGKKIENFVRNEAIKELKLAVAELQKTKKKVVKKRKPVKRKATKKKTTKRKISKKKPVRKKRKPVKKKVTKKRTTKKKKR